MLRRLWMAAALTALTALCAVAADQPKLAGNWKMNADKSDFGPSPMKPEKFDRKIEQSATEVKVSTTQAMNGQERTTDVSYITDGKEHVVKAGQADVKVTAQYDGGALKVVSAREIQGMEIKVEEKWTVDEAGKVMTVDSVIHTPQGDFNLKIVLEKQ